MSSFAVSGRKSTSLAEKVLEQEGLSRLDYGMDHNKNQPPDRKAFYIGPFVIGCAVAVLLGIIIMRQPAPQKPAQPAPIVARPATKVPLSVTPSILGRTEMLAHAAQATAQFAATGKFAGKDAFVGRRFSLRLPFGCNGANGLALNPQAVATYDAAQESLVLTAQPGVWTSLPIMQPLMDAGKIETVEGFWLPRPWTQSEECPPQDSAFPPAIATPATAQTLGLAQLFPAGSARTLRHSQHPYSLVRKVAPVDTEQLSRTYYLVLEGTITGYPDGSALRCWAEAADHQPICVYAVTFDRVAFGDASTGNVLASWTD